MTARWTCDEVEPKLTAYRLGELPPDEEAAITLHLEACPICREASEDILETLALLDDALAEEAVPLTVLPGAAETEPDAAPGRMRDIMSWLGLPTDRSQWIGSLARAALILILPLTLVLGLLLPGLRMLDGRERMAARMREIEAFTNTAAQSAVAMRSGELPSDLELYDVALSDEPPAFEVDAMEGPGLANAFREGVDILTGTVEVAAEFWSGEPHLDDPGIASGLGLAGVAESNVAALVRATQPAAPRVSRPIVAADSVATVRAPVPHRKIGNKPHLIETVASHPGYNLTNAPPRTGSESELHR